MSQEQNYNISYTQQITKSSSPTDTVSKVLLLCVYEAREEDIYNDAVFQIFSQYGLVNKVLIFERGKITKVFVEMCTEEVAQVALQQLDSQTIMNNKYKINVYFSKLQNLDLQSKKTKGSDYTQRVMSPGYKSGGNKLFNPPSSYTEEDKQSDYSIQNDQIRQKNWTYGYIQNNDQQPANQGVQERKKAYTVDQGLQRQFDGLCINNIMEHNEELNFIKENQFEDHQKNEEKEQKMEQLNKQIDQQYNELLNDSINKLSITLDKNKEKKLQQADYIQQSLPTAQQQQNKQYSFTNQSTANTLYGQQLDYSQCSSISKESMQQFVNNDTSADIDQIRPKTLSLNLQPTYDTMSSSPYMIRIPSHSISTPFPPELKQQQQQIQSQSNIDQSNMTKLQNLQQQQQNGINIRSQDINAIFENRKSPVIYVKGLENKDITLTMIFNLFSNFGNIQKILLIRSKQAALIQYENIEYAIIAKDQLNNMSFLGCQMRIHFSKYDEINIKNKRILSGEDGIQLQQQQLLLQQEEHLIVNKDNYRFKKNKPTIINPPSQTIHISNLKKEMCLNEVQIREIFQEFGKVENIKFLFDNQKNMCLVKFSTFDESFKAIAFMHNKNFYGRNIQISFTKSKI